MFDCQPLCCSLNFRHDRQSDRQNTVRVLVDRCYPTNEVLLTASIHRRGELPWRSCCVRRGITTATRPSTCDEHSITGAQPDRRAKYQRPSPHVPTISRAVLPALGVLERQNHKHRNPSHAGTSCIRLGFCTRRSGVEGIGEN